MYYFKAIFEQKNVLPKNGINYIISSLLQIKEI